MDNRIPTLSSDVEIAPFNGNEYIVDNRVLKHKLNISSNTYLIISLVDGTRTVSEIATNLKLHHNLEVTVEFVSELLFVTLGKYGIIVNEDIIPQRQSKPSYLKLSFIFIPPKIVDILSYPFRFLFHRWIFYPLLVLLSSIVLFTIINNYGAIGDELQNANLSFGTIVLFIILFQVGNLFHEIGHATAMKSFGKRTGGIGFGFYLFTPALFTDVSDAWRLPISKRIIVNLAGIYFELILCGISMVIYAFEGNPIYLYMPCILMLSTVINLNPFMKFDGYWILSDLARIPNLQRKSYSVLKNKLLQFIKLNFSFSSSREVLLLCYSVISVSFIITFLGTVVLTDSKSLYLFPLYIVDIFQHADTINLAVVKLLFVPLIFWYLIFRLTQAFLRNFNWSSIKM